MEVAMLVGDTPYHFPGTLGWLESKLDHRARFELRQALREVVRVLDARLVWLWVADRPGSTSVLEYAGDTTALPKRMPELRTSLPERDAVSDRRGESHDTVWLRVAMGGGVPRLGVALLGLEHAATPDLFDAIECLGEQLEAALVRALERAASREAAPTALRSRARHTWDGRPE